VRGCSAERSRRVSPSRRAALAARTARGEPATVLSGEQVAPVVLAEDVLQQQGVHVDEGGLQDRDATDVGPSSGAWSLSTGTFVRVICTGAGTRPALGVVLSSGEPPYRFPDRHVLELEHGPGLGLGVRGQAEA
jgi:hypothetical protein